MHGDVGRDVGVRLRVLRPIERRWSCDGRASSPCAGTAKTAPPPTPLQTTHLVTPSGGAEDKDAPALIELHHARAGIEICAHEHEPHAVILAYGKRSCGLGFRPRTLPSTSRKVRHDGRHSSRRALTARMRSCAAGPATQEVRVVTCQSLTEGGQGWVVCRRRTCVAEEEMIRPRVDERLALDPQTRLHVLESTQICIVPDVRGNLHDDKSARNEERGPYAVEKKQREHPVWHNEVFPLPPERRRSGMEVCGNRLLALRAPAPMTFCAVDRRKL
jgi:hypothetical protein